MFVTTRAEYTWDGAQYVLIHVEGYDYVGPRALCGGGPSQATQEQQQVNLEASQQQLAFDQQLMTLFQQQYANQQSQLKYLQGVLKPVIANAIKGNGFSTSELASMRTTATDTISGAYQNAQKALNTNERATGDVNVPSSVNSGLEAGLLNSEAQTKAGTQNQITVANAQLANSNLFNAINALNGVQTSTTNPLGFASAATGGAGTIAGLSSSQAGLQNSITNANNSGFFGSLMNSLGSSIGGSVFGSAGTLASQMGSGNIGW